MACELKRVWGDICRRMITSKASVTANYEHDMLSVLETDLIVQQINETSCDQTISAEDCFVTVC